jgi:hypothetical protein
MVYAFFLLSRYVVFVALGIVTLCPLSLTLLLIGLYGAHRWGDKESILANIYCIVRHMDPEGQVWPYSQIKMCMCVILNIWVE